LGQNDIECLVEEYRLAIFALVKTGVLPKCKLYLQIQL